MLQRSNRLGIEVMFEVKHLVIEDPQDWVDFALGSAHRRNELPVMLLRQLHFLATTATE